MQTVNPAIAMKASAGVTEFTVQMAPVAIKTAIGSVLGSGVIVAVLKAYVELERHFVVLKQANLARDFEVFRMNGVGSCGPIERIYIWRKEFLVKPS